MRLNGLRCDGCGKEDLFEYDPLRARTDHNYLTIFDMLPHDWFLVAQGQKDTEPWTFCSKECVKIHPLESGFVARRRHGMSARSIGVVNGEEEAQEEA
jgi:hypothetical protein